MIPMFRTLAKSIAVATDIFSLSPVIS